MSVRIRQTAPELLPTGEYLARIVDITLDIGQFGPQLRFRFEIDDGEHQGKQITGWTSQSFNRKWRLYSWTGAALNGRAIPPDWTFDSDKLIGRQVTLVVTRKTGDDGLEHNRIEAVLPARTQAASQPAAPPVVRSSQPPAADDGWPGSEEVSDDDWLRSN